MTGLALLMKKGIRLEVIHDLDRPFEEMMYGLESWIPLYMTGQVSPYYLNLCETGYIGIYSILPSIPHFGANV